MRINDLDIIRDHAIRLAVTIDEDAIIKCAEAGCPGRNQPILMPTAIVGFSVDDLIEKIDDHIEASRESTTGA